MVVVGGIGVGDGGGGFRLPDVFSCGVGHVVVAIVAVVVAVVETSACSYRSICC